MVGGPSTFTMYITALYFCMTCMTSIGFGNVAADTDNEKVSALTINHKPGNIQHDSNLNFLEFIVQF